MKKAYRLMPVLAMATPMVAFAATLMDILNTVRGLINAIVPLLMVLAVAVFLWGIVKYITAGGNTEKEKEARGYVIYGLIGIFVLVSFWGIIQIFATTLGVQTGGTLPTVDVSGLTN